MLRQTKTYTIHVKQTAENSSNGVILSEIYITLVINHLTCNDMAMDSKNYENRFADICMLDMIV